VRNTHRSVLSAGMADCDAWAVLIPGFTGSKEDFIALPEPLAASGVGMVTFDQIGQHESAGSDDPEDYALDELAKDTAAIIEYAKVRFDRSDEPHLLGHSFGGLVAQQALVAEHLEPRSFIAFCTGPGGLPAERWGALPDLVDALPHTDLGELWERKLEIDAEAGAPLPPREVQEFLASRWMRNHPRQLKQFAHILMEQPSFTSRLRSVVDRGLRMAVMWGQFDDAWPIPMQQAMARQLGVPGIELPGVGHSPNAEDPVGTAAALLQFWRG
jgi:pimeloyl-ACP methyl ester carboxylesterase